MVLVINVILLQLADGIELEVPLVCRRTVISAVATSKHQAEQQQIENPVNRKVHSRTARVSSFCRTSVPKVRL
jgi:hypothetical protein